MPHTDIKLIALDIDGTIMDKNFRISGKVKEAISQAVKKGVHVLIATGRMYSATVPIGVELGLKTPLIVYQGGLIKEFYRSDRTLLHYPLDVKTTYSVINDARTKDIQINVYFDDELYVEQESPMLQEYASARNISYRRVDRFEDMGNFLPTKILLMDRDVQKTDFVLNEFREKYSDKLYVTKSTDYFCELINKKCSKADAIKFLADKWQIERSEIMAIGDHENDREMLDFAGLGVAMGNSSESLKLAADYVTDTVDNDGAALAIEKFVV